MAKDKDRMIPFDEVAKKWRNNPGYKKAHAALEAQFVLYEAMIDAKIKKGLSQKQIAEKMGTSETALSRMLGGKQLPSWNTIMKFAEATGTRPVLKFVDA